MYEELIEELRRPHADCNPWALMEQAADAIEELSKQIKTVQCVNIGDLECDSNQLCTCMGIVRKRLEEDEKKPRWIPVTERLPEVFTHVLVNIPGMYPHPTVKEAFCEKNGMWYSNGFRYGADEITHWMPLPPEPPKEETCTTKNC